MLSLTTASVLPDVGPAYFLGLVSNHSLHYSSHTDLLLIPEHAKLVPAFKPLHLLSPSPGIPSPRTLPGCTFSLFKSELKCDVPQRGLLLPPTMEAHSHLAILSLITPFHFYSWLLSIPKIIFKILSV